MSLAGIIEVIIKDALPSEAHGIIGSMAVSLGGAEAPTNATFTQTYNFVIPLCATMGVFCILLLVFIGVCIWFERTHEVPEDDKDRARKMRQCQSEDDKQNDKSDNEDPDQCSRGSRRSSRRPGNRVDVDDVEYLLEQPRRSAQMSRQQSALCNTDPSLKKKTSSTTPSFRQPPPVNSGNNNSTYSSGNSYTRPPGVANLRDSVLTNNNTSVLNPVAARQRANQPIGGVPSFDGACSSPATVVGQLCPSDRRSPQKYYQQEHMQVQTQQQRQQGSAAMHGQSRVPHDSNHNMSNQNLNFTDNQYGSPSYPAPPPTYGEAEQQRPLSSVANPQSSKKEHRQQRNGDTPQQPQRKQRNHSVSVDPPACQQASQRRQLSKHRHNNSHHSQQQEREQQQQPMHNYTNVYGGYSQTSGQYAAGPYTNTYGYPTELPSQGGWANPYAYP